MKITTYQFGEIEFNEDSIINFSTGIFGFENLKKFLLVQTEEGLFHWLNSVEQPEIAFPVILLRVIDESFPKTEEHEAFGVVTFNPDPLKVTVNMKAPIYIDQNNKSGYQTILDEDALLINYNLFVQE
jgi:flagellar assembly factor FliW